MGFWDGKFVCIELGTWVIVGANEVELIFLDERGEIVDGLAEDDATEGMRLFIGTADGACHKVGNTVGVAVGDFVVGLMLEEILG